MLRDDDGDDQRGERSLREILMARLRAAHGDEETRARRGVEEEERNRFLIDTILSVAADSFFGKRETDESDSQQNPNRRDASSSSSKSSVESTSPDEEPVSKIKPLVKGKSVKGLKKQGKVLRGSGSSHGNAYENMEVDPYADTVATEAALGKRKRKIDEDESHQQNPNSHDASSSSFSSVEAVRIERMVMPEWVVERMRKENAADAKMVTEKGLTASDLSTQLARLLIPFNQIEEMDFLNEAEQIIIEEHRSKISKKGVPVNLVMNNKSLKQWKLNLKRWDMKTSSNYVLNSGWNGVVRDNRFRENQVIRLWSFHSRLGELFFALELVPRHPARASDPDMALAPALTQAQDPVPAAASSSALAPVVTTGNSEELCIGEEASRIKAQEEMYRMLTNFPKRRRSANVRVPATTRDSDNLGQSIVEGMDQNRTLGQVCTEEMDQNRTLGQVCTEEMDQNRALGQVCTVEMAPVEAEEETSVMTDMMAAEILLQLASGQNS
ncbi:unnamed protein product [Thlaspi arvense]|uniref:TF-B3 domain-containing protein n=1 Tax=Thlaspi arvense TaxID=13288 RepID=A0AAU9SCI7_THLAR|nr:unnamed protein product [Thlaspi arvense]